MFKSFQSNIPSNYTLSPRPTCTTGAWQVFAATHKKTNKAVSVFVFDRKTLEVGGLESRSSSSSSQRRIHAEVIERLKKEASSIARLRHPSVLELAEPVEETRTGLMFATEPVVATLRGLLAEKDQEEEREGTNGARLRRYSNNAGKERTSSIALDELEIQKGLQQVAKGLEFLHESAGLVHGNLTPDAIYVNGKSDWKIAALGFSGPPEDEEVKKPGMGAPIALSELLYNDPRLPPAVQLNMDYTSPDFVLDNKVSTSADMFSLGLMVIALYNSPHRSPVRTHGNASTYKKIFSASHTVPSVSNNFLSSKPLPQQLTSQVLPRLITRRAANRMTAREFQQSAFFDNVLVSTLEFLEALPAKTPNEKSQFMRGLPRILDQFPRSVLEKKLLPGLLEETKDRELLALILGNVFKVMVLLKGEGQRAFTDLVVPKLKEVFLSSGKNDRDSLKEGGLVIVLENLALITENCDGRIFKDDILPIYNLGLESPTSAIVDKTLGCLSVVLPKLDFSTIKNELFPVVAQVFAKTSSLMIKVRGLDALNTLCGGKADVTTASKNASGILDKYTVQEKIVPLVKAIKTKEPAVMMAALTLLNSITAICDYDFLATSVLPVAWAFSLGPLLNLEQFNRYMELIRSISTRIQQEHTRKLRELATTTGNGADTNGSNGFGDPNDLMGDISSSDDIFGTGAGQDDFTALVLGKKTASPSSGNGGNAWELPSRPSIRNTTSMSSSSLHTPTLSAGSQMPWGSGTNSLANHQSVTRAITPDSMMGSIPALQPNRSGMTMTTSMTANPGISSQSNPWASPPIASTTSAMSSSSISGGGGGGGGSIDWSAARQAQMPTRLQPTSYMASPPPIQPQPQQTGFGAVGGGTFGLQPPPSSTGTGMGNMLFAQPQQQQQQQQQQRFQQQPIQQQQFQQQQQQPPPGAKSGLDKYESLI